MSTDQNMADYSYTPSLVMAMIFIAIFGGSSLVHLVQTCKSTRQKWMCCFALGGITNNRSAWVVGEGVVALQSGGGRVPRPDQFANYWTNFLLCRAVHAFGRGDPPSRLHVGFHVGQGVQEHLCNSRRRVPPPPSRRRWNRAAATTADHQNLGSKIMLIGIAFQLAVMVFYVLYALQWLLRARKSVSAAGPKMKRLIGGMAICSIAFIVRGIYRTIELNHGFHGALAENQMAFLLDTIPISIAIISFNVYHPSRLLPQTPDAFLLPLGSKVSV